MRAAMSSGKRILYSRLRSYAVFFDCGRRGMAAPNPGIYGDERGQYLTPLASDHNPLFQLPIPRKRGKPKSSVLVPLRKPGMRLHTMSRTLRQLHYYTVPGAGRQAGMGRSQSYRAAEAGLIPVERDGKFMLVPKATWDRKLKRLGLLKQNAAPR